MATGFSFADDPQMSIREKIEKYFQQKKTAAALNTVPVLDESLSDDSLSNSLSALDESFAQILNNNPHVTLIRNSKKGNASQMESTQTFHQNHHQQQQTTTKPPYMPTPTRRGEIKPPFSGDDSAGSYPLFWEVSDESFLEMEQFCESPRKSVEDFDDHTVLDDIEAPSFLSHDSFDDSVFAPEPSSVSMLSPMKLVGLRRPSTILEESTIQSMNSSEERSRASLSLKHSLNVPNSESSESDKTRSFRPSLVNVFPTRGRIGYYNNFDNNPSPSSSPSSVSVKSPVKQNLNKENSISLIRFDSIEPDPPSSGPATPTNGNRSISLMRFDSSVDEASFCNLSLDQTQFSMSDDEPPDQFNDTLEAVDYYMKRGQKIMDKTNASTVQHQVLPSPKSRNNSLLKQTLARRHLMSMNGDNLNKFTGKKLF